MTTQENNRQHIVAALSFLEDESPEDFLSYLNNSEASEFKKVIASYDEIHEKKDYAKRQLQKMLAHNRFSSIAEVHPAWVLEKLQTESPRVIGVILRYLPPRHMRYIIEHLPEKIRSELPDMVDAFVIPEAVLEVIRDRFEQNFAPMKFAHPQGQLEFKDLYYLKFEELEDLFIDLGIHEIALAMNSMSRRAVKMLLNRFSLKDAKLLQRRIKSTGLNKDKVEFEALCHSARMTILDAASEHVGSKQLFLDVGIANFARCYQADVETLYQFILQKIPPEMGFMLKRELMQKAGQTQADQILTRQNIVLDRVVELATNKQIDPSWAKFFAHSDPEDELEELSDQQLA